MDEMLLAQNYDIMEDRRRLSSEFERSDELETMTSEIEVFNLKSITLFGAKAAEAISKSSDNILKSLGSSTVGVPSELFKTLAGIMSRFDISEIKEDHSFLTKIFGNGSNKIEKLLAKYYGLGDEVDRIYVQLRQYEKEIQRANRLLDDLFEANVQSYHQLVKYVLAGERGCKELEAVIGEKEAELRQTGNETIQFDIASLKTALNMLERRIHDLRLTETVALQSIPMIKTMQLNNSNLIKKIDAAFIVTLPVFKQSLTQAIMLKKNRIQSDAMQRLEKKAREMAKNNPSGLSQNARDMNVERMNVKNLDALESSWKTITTGISETEELQNSLAEKRLEDKNKLEFIKSEYNKEVMSEQTLQ